MPIPADILAVPRPKNTIVKSYGKDPVRYSVVQRIGCERRNGKNYPVNGPVIGHIVDGQYVPKVKPPAVKVSVSGNIDLKEWGLSLLCDKLFRPVLEELKEIWHPEDATMLYCMALLMVCEPTIDFYEMKDAYDQSFLSELLPDVALSRNTVCTFLQDVGKNCSMIHKFMRNRAARIKMDDRILIDGTLKTNDTKISSLSNFSRKAKPKGRKDISVLYAYDMEKKEPVCSECFPGNMLDVTAYDAFIETNGIKSGVLIGDKGFPASAIEEVLHKNPDLHYLNPVRRNSRFVKTHELTRYEGVLSGYPGVLYKKAKVQGKKKWLYAFQDTEEAAMEERDWLKNRDKNQDYSQEEYEKKQEEFGTIVLESSLDMECLTAYKMYMCRWEIELVMRFYKEALDFQTVQVHNDDSVTAAEFVEFLAVLLTFKLLNWFDEHQLLEKNTYVELTKKLRRVKKVKVDGKDWQFIKMNPRTENLLEALELVEPVMKPPKKRGRPRTKPLPDPDAPKKKRGRPPKKASPAE